MSSSSSSPSQGFPMEGGSFKGRVRRYIADVLYEMVDDPSTDAIVSWSQDGKSFIFWDEDKFTSDLLPTFGHGKFPVFTDRLTVTYRFRKVEESEHCEYAHDYFVRGKPELAVEIHRQFKERCVPINIKNFPPPEPGFRERREKMIALYLVQRAAKRLSLKD